MSSTQVTTWRRYTKAEKKAYRARQRRRLIVDARLYCIQMSFYADNYGSRVNGEVL